MSAEGIAFLVLAGLAVGIGAVLSLAAGIALWHWIAR